MSDDDEDEEDEDDEMGIPKARGKRSKKTKNGTESSARTINKNKLTYRQAAGKNKQRLMRGSVIERTLEIDMPSISNKIAIGLESNPLMDP